MPLEDGFLSREPDGTFNEDYCKWCYADGKFVYTDQSALVVFLAVHMTNESWPPDQVRAHFEGYLHTQTHWRKGEERPPPTRNTPIDSKKPWPLGCKRPRLGCG